MSLRSALELGHKAGQDSKLDLFHFLSKGKVEHRLRVLRFHGEERVNTPYEIDLELLAPVDVDPVATIEDALLGGDAAPALGIRRYVQCHTLDEASYAAMTTSRGSLPGYDGVAELWFDSLEQCLAARGPDAREAGRALLEDERRFIDLARSPLFFANELPVHPKP